MITILIPYLHRLSQGDELKQSIRSMCENALFEFDIVLVGDKPEWYKGKFIKTKPIRGVNFARSFDIAKKLHLICKSDLITEDFVYTYDDVYFIDKVSLDDINGAIALQKMKPVNTGSKWRQLLEKTLKKCYEYKHDVWNYETHLPRVLNKYKLQSLIERPEFDLTKEPYLFNTLYFNLLFKKPKLVLEESKDQTLKAGIYSSASAKNYKDEVKGKKILNHSQSAYNVPDFRQYVDNLFQEKCKFEK